MLLTFPNLQPHPSGKNFGNFVHKLMRCLILLLFFSEKLPAGINLPVDDFTRLGIGDRTDIREEKKVDDGRISKAINTILATGNANDKGSLNIDLDLIRVGKGTQTEVEAKAMILTRASKLEYEKLKNSTEATSEEIDTAWRKYKNDLKTFEHEEKKGRDMSCEAYNNEMEHVREQIFRNLPKDQRHPIWVEQWEESELIDLAKNTDRDLSLCGESIFSVAFKNRKEARSPEIKMCKNEDMKNYNSLLYKKSLEWFCSDAAPEMPCIQQISSSGHLGWNFCLDKQEIHSSGAMENTIKIILTGIKLGYKKLCGEEVMPAKDFVLQLHLKTVD